MIQTPLQSWNTNLIMALQLSLIVMRTSQTRVQNQNLANSTTNMRALYGTQKLNLQAQVDAVQLAQLYADIKARAELPDPTYEKLPRSRPTWPFDVRTLPNYVQYPMHYFELFWGLEVWNTLVQNNAYAQYKKAECKENKAGKVRWQKAITLYEMRIFITLLIYISIIGTSNIDSYQDKGGNTIYKPIYKTLSVSANQAVFPCIASNYNVIACETRTSCQLTSYKVLDLCCVRTKCQF